MLVTAFKTACVNKQNRELYHCITEAGCQQITYQIYLNFLKLNRKSIKYYIVKEEKNPQILAFNFECLSIHVSLCRALLLKEINRVYKNGYNYPAPLSYCFCIEHL